MTYIYAKGKSELKGFYLAKHHACNDIQYLSTCMSVPEGNLEVLYYLYIVIDDCYNFDNTGTMSTNMYHDYIKDLQYIERVGCDDTQYVQQIINQLCQMQDTNLAKEIVLSDISPQSCRYTAPTGEIACVKSQISCVGTVTDDNCTDVEMYNADVTNFKSTRQVFTASYWQFFFIFLLLLVSCYPSPMKKNDPQGYRALST